jgi:hypothetical protein
MKFIWLLLGGICFTFFDLQGQDFTTIYPDRTLFFTTTTNSAMGLRIDSVIYGPEITCYPNRTVRGISWDCTTPKGIPWIGDHITIREDGTNLFFNKNMDTVKINTLSPLHDSWRAFYIPDSISVIATVEQYDTLGFLGLNDSVKTIGFQVFDRNMLPRNNILNDMKIKISKNYGFVQALNFYLFNDLDYTNESIQEHVLAGMTNPAVGLQNLTWREVYDFQPGDELHIQHQGYEGIMLKYIRNKVLRYLSRTDFEDSIVYACSLKENIDTYTEGLISNAEYLESSFKLKIRDNQNFDKLPGEPIIQDNSLYWFSSYVDPIAKVDMGTETLYYPGDDSCWQSPIIDGCGGLNTYIKGLGGPYYSCDGYWTLESELLVYYKKGDKIWGTPLVITSVPDIPEIDEITVFPNPARDEITITARHYAENNFELFDAAGCSIISKQLYNQSSIIDINQLKPGLYFYYMTKDKRVIKMGKLVKN